MFGKKKDDRHDVLLSMESRITNLENTPTVKKETEKEEVKVAVEVDYDIHIHKSLKKIDDFIPELVSCSMITSWFPHYVCKYNLKERIAKIKEDMDELKVFRKDKYNSDPKNFCEFLNLGADKLLVRVTLKITDNDFFSEIEYIEVAADIANDKLISGKITDTSEAQAYIKNQCDDEITIEFTLKN